MYVMNTTYKQELSTRGRQRDRECVKVKLRKLERDAYIPDKAALNDKIDEPIRKQDLHE